MDTITHQDRTYLIIGAYGGIGRALSAHLSEQGARLLLAGREAEPLEELADQLDQDLIEADAADFEQVEACFERADQLFDGPDGVVNCAGNLMLKPAHRTDFDDYMRTVHTNLTTAFATVRGAGASMRRGGAVLLFASAAARIGLAGHEAIAAAKGGVIGLTRAAAATYADRGLRVNCLAPGMIQTPLTEPITEDESSREFSIDMHGLDRLGEPEDIVPPASWLLSEQAEWVTGHVFDIDGGLSSVKPRD